MASYGSREIGLGKTGNYVDDAKPDLRLLRAVAELEELTDAVDGLTNAYGCRMKIADPLWPLARDVARALIEAGFMLHRCRKHDQLHRLGGVCLLPVGSEHNSGGEAGIVVSWTTHDLLSLDSDRYGDYRGAHDAMNPALGVVLEALRFPVQPFGTGGAWIVTGRQEVRR